VRPPVIDKISITVPVADHSLRTQVLAHLKSAEIGGKGKDIKKAWNWQARKEYWIAINCTLMNDQTLLIQANHKQTDSHLLRLEFNPAKQGQWGLGYLKHKFDEITGGLLDWGHVVKYGRATRLDIAVDLVGVRMSELIVSSNVPGKNHLYISEDGQIETAYLGMPGVNKPTEQLAYDKLQHAEDQGYKPLYDGILHTRVEMIVKSTGQKLSKINNVKNPLGRVAVVHPRTTPPGIDPVVWAMFLDTCRFKGVTAALTALPECAWGPFLAPLQSGAKLCWRPDWLWNHWPMTVKASELLKSA